MKRKVKIVIIPANEATNILLTGRNELIYITKDFGFVNSIDRFQHLYFLSDEEIKEGDWCLLDKNVGLSTGYEVKQCLEVDSINGEHTFAEDDGSLFTTGRCSKIVATTDEGLGYGDNVGAFYQLPRPSNEFIKKYCELGGIDKVLVEYIDTGDKDFSKRYRLKIAPDNTITIKPIRQK